MGLFWKAPVGRAAQMLQDNGKRELFWYGVTIGQIGFGLLVSHPRKKGDDDLAVRGAPCGDCGGVVFHSSNCPTQPSGRI